MALKKKLAAGVGALALVWIFVPEPTDVVPFLGWIDEGLAMAALMWAMKTLGVTPAGVMQRLRGGAPALTASATR